MARVEFNPIIDRMIGKCGDTVYKMRNGRQYAAKVPDRSGHVATEGELANRLKFKQATAYARSILANPEKRAPYDAAAAASGRIAFNLIVSEFYQALKVAQANETLDLPENAMEPVAEEVPAAAEMPSEPVMAASCGEPADLQSDPGEEEPAAILPAQETDRSSSSGEEVAVEPLTGPHVQPVRPVEMPEPPGTPAMRSRSRSRKRLRRGDRDLSTTGGAIGNPGTNRRMSHRTNHRRAEPRRTAFQAARRRSMAGAPLNGLRQAPPEDDANRISPSTTRPPGNATQMRHKHPRTDAHTADRSHNMCQFDIVVRTPYLIANAYRWSPFLEDPGNHLCSPCAGKPLLRYR